MHITIKSTKVKLKLFIFTLATFDIEEHGLLKAIRLAEMKMDGIEINTKAEKR